MSDNLLDQVADDTQATAGFSLANASSTDPEVAARRQRAASVLGLPAAAIDDPKEAERRIAVRQANETLGAAPTTTSWLVNPQNAAVAHDHVPTLANIEGLHGLAFPSDPLSLARGIDWFNQRLDPGAKPGDVFRAVGSSATGATGSIVRGFGSLLDTVIRMQEGPDERAFEAEIGDHGPMPSQVTAGPGAELIAKAQAGKPAVSTPITAGLSAVTSFAPAIGAALLSPALGAGVFASQGADTATQDAAAKGAEGSAKADEAVAANAVLQGGLGLVGIKLPGAGLILPKIASPALRVLSHLGIGAVENAATGAAMQAGSNVIEHETFDPNKNVGEGVADTAGQMALFGTAFHAAHALPGAMRELAAAGVARAQAQANLPFEQAVAEAQAAPLAQRAPDRFADLMANVANGEHVYVPADTLREFMQSKLAPDDQAAFVAATGIGDQLATAEGPGADIAIPADKYLAVVAQTPGAHEAFADSLRLAPDAMSPAEAREFDKHYADFIAARGEALTAQSAADAQAMAPAHEVYQKVFSQAREAGYTIDAAQQYASLYAARYETRGARLGTDALTEFQRAGTGQGVDIRQVVPPELMTRFDRLDPVIDALRKGSKTAPAEGPSLLDFLSRNGGVQDQGGELSRVEAQDWHKGKAFRSRLVREDGQTLEHATEAATDAGYLREGAQPQDLLNAMEGELRGSKVLSAPVDQRGADFHGAVQALDEVLGRLGIDPSTASNAEIKAALKEYNSNNISTFRQPERGSISFGDSPAIIRLFKGRDLSTLLHETGHLWLEELRADAERSPELKADFEAVQKWLGPDGDFETEHHETFARGFEAYLMEGHAPSEGLRGVFQKFRSWLLNIYRNVAGLNVEVTPEIKAVFDRLVATDDEIAAAAKRESLNPIFDTPEAGNMTAVEWAAYTKALNASNEAARDHLMARLMRDVRRTRTKEWAAERASLREETAKTVDSRPDVRAYHYLTRGELLGVDEQPGAHKLDRQVVAMTYGTDAVIDRLPRGSTVESGGVHPDDIAQLTGHTSGEAMMNAVMALEDMRRTQNIPPRGVRKLLTDQATDAEMVSRHGDALRDGSIEEEAADALHNDERMRLVSMEVAALGKASGEAQWSREILERYAETSIAARRLGDLRPDAFLRAERQCGNEAQRKLLAGDQVGALERKRQQLINMHLYRAARDAQVAMDRAQKLFERLAKTRSLSTMAQDYLDQIHGVLQRYGYRVPQTNLAADFEAWKAEREAEGETVIDSTPPVRPLKDLSVQEVSGLKDTIDNLAHLGRREKELLVAGRRERLSDLADEVSANVFKSKVKAKIDTRGVIPSNWGAQARASLMKMETMADMMDLGDGQGPFNRVLVHGSSDANAREYELQHSVLDQLRTHYDGVPYENRKDWRRLMDHTLLDPRNNQPMKLTKANVVAMALNMGNSENFGKLAGGYQWDAESVRALVMKTLTKEDWQFVQGTWDAINSLWPDIVKTERALSGVAPKKVVAEPIVTPHGTFAGGYYPIKYDAQRSAIARENEDRNLEGAFGHKLTGAGTRTGFTKERTGAISPISLSPERVIFGHMRDVVKRIAWGEWFLDANRFLKNTTVTRAIEARLGNEYRDALVKLTRTSVGYNLLDERSLGWLERLLRTWRVNGVTNIAGFNPRILFEHTAAHAQSIAVLGKSAWAKGVADYASDPIGKAQFIFDRSPEMRARKDQANQNIADLMADIAEHRDIIVNLAEQVGIKPSVVEAVRKAPHMPISAVNLRAVAMPTWLGGYHKALGEGRSELEAIRAGDKAVRVSHASGAAKDLALAQQGNEFYRIFTTFFAYHQNQWNLYERSVEDVRQATTGRDYRRSLESFIWALPVAAVVGGLVAGRGPKKDADPVEIAEWAADTMIRALWEGVPLARNIGSGTLDVLEGKGANSALDDAFSTPALRGARSVALASVDLTRMVRQALGDETVKEPSEKWMQHLIEAPGYFLGLPMLSIARSAEYGKELAQGTQQPESVGEAAAGFAFGPPPKIQ